MLVGAHVSAAGTYERMVDYALSVGCECVQIFAKSPRQWNAKPIDEEIAASFRTLSNEKNLGPVLTHTAYLINLSTNNEELRQKSIKALADELRRGTLLGADAVNTHIGNDPAENPKEAVKRAADSIEQAFALLGGPKASTRLVLENTAGAGTSFGDTIEGLADVVELVGLPYENLGITIDTCHAWAAGYDVASQEGWDDLVSLIDTSMGIDRFRWIHANDCKFGRGMKKDRHEWIGDGEIGIAGFRAMMTHPLLTHVSVATEMPGEVPEKDIVNINRLKALRDGEDPL